MQHLKTNIYAGKGGRDAQRLHQFDSGIIQIKVLLVQLLFQKLTKFIFHKFAKKKIIKSIIILSLSSLSLFCI